MKPFFLTNSLSGKKEKFVPADPQNVKIYSCGPTVYDFAHIGNFRSFLTADVLVRTLKYAGLGVHRAQNITDVGHLTNDDLADGGGADKILNRAKAEKKDPFEIARYFETCFCDDEKFLRILPPNAGRPRATDFIPQQLQLAKTLIKKGFAYSKNGSVYFRTQNFKKYGCLSKNPLEKLLAGARVEINAEKEHPLDFALWKKAEPEHLMQWDFETGERCDPESKNPNAGFPGWHIECSAMSAQIFLPEVFGENGLRPAKTQIDLHTGGEDNLFPHHECEIAQNEAGFGGQIRYWMHTKHLLLNGEKMSKSAGNFLTIRDLRERGFSGAGIRLALISAHYRSTLNFSETLLQSAEKNIQKFQNFIQKFSSTPPAPIKSSETKTLLAKFDQEMCDDLNVPGALAAAFEMLAAAQKSPELASEVLYFLKYHFDPIFDILEKQKSKTPEEIAAIEHLISDRQKARERRDFEAADRIRAQLERDFEVRISDEGGRTRWGDW